MTKTDTDGLKARLDAKCESCGGVAGKYKDAFRDGVRDAGAVLDAHAGRPASGAMEELRRKLAERPYLSGEKTEAYRKAVRSAMSMLDGLEP